WPRRASASCRRPPASPRPTSAADPGLRRRPAGALGSGPMATQRHDVLVIGGGPAGAAAGFWLAKAGHDVCVLERKAFPRDKTCGDGLTPRAVHQLRAMGLEPAIAARHHRHEGLRAV